MNSGAGIAQTLLWLAYGLDQGWRNCGTQAQNGRLSQFSFIYFARPASLYCEEHVYIYTLFSLSRDCMWITVATKWYCQLNIFTEIGNRAQCWLDIQGDSVARSQTIVYKKLCFWDNNLKIYTHTGHGVKQDLLIIDAETGLLSHPSTLECVSPNSGILFPKCRRWRLEPLGV